MATTTRALLQLCPRQALCRRGYATVRQDLHGLYNLPKPPTAVRPRPPPKRPTSPSSAAGKHSQEEISMQRRRWMLGAGGVGLVALVYLIANEPAHKTEAPAPATAGFDPATPVALQLGDGLVDSGTTSVPPFPTRVTAPDNAEYALLGLGIRTVSFLSIQVYVVGFYVHVDDLAAVQTALVRRVDPTASSITALEKEELRKRLLDPVEGEKLWEEVLAGGAQFRSLFRIVPTRNTDFQHLRDGWVRGIQARSTKNESYDDDAFTAALAEFKALFGGAFKKSVPKQKTLLLARDAAGVFGVYYDPTGRNDGKLGGKGEEQTVQNLGSIRDPRVAKALWLCYLAGAKPASEPARKSIIEGVLALASRPAATLGV